MVIKKGIKREKFRVKWSLKCVTTFFLISKRAVARKREITHERNEGSLSP
jgi:hypothetical protein